MLYCRSSCSSGNVKALTVTSSNTNNSNNSSASVSPLLGSHISDSSNSYSSSIQSPASSSHTNKKCPLSPPSSRASRSPPSTDHDHELTSDTSEVEISTGGSSRVVTRQHSSESSDEVSNSSDDCGIVTPDIGRKSSDSRHQQQFIVNCCSGYIDRPVKWGPLPTMVANSYLKNPIQTAVRYPNCNMTNNKCAKHYFFPAPIFRLVIAALLCYYCVPFACECNHSQFKGRGCCMTS